MSLPLGYDQTYLPVKSFLASYRALNDARHCIKVLDEMVSSGSIAFYTWRVHWVTACVLLRTSIDLFRDDAKSCLVDSLKIEMQAEWKFIAEKREESNIFWKFIRLERDNIVHEYKWGAYVAWIRPDGSEERPSSLLAAVSDDVKTVLLMQEGHYKGRNSVELLNEGADWIEQRIHAAILRAGFDPDEERSLSSFAKRPDVSRRSLLLGALLDFESPDNAC